MRKWAALSALCFLVAGGTASASLSLTPAPGFGPYLYTETIGPNGAGFSEGWFFSVGTFVSDPNGVPGNLTSVTASQEGGVNFFQLTYFYKLAFFPYWGVENIREPYSPSRPTGQWTITATNKDGDVVSADTHILDRPGMVPTTAVRFEQFGVDWVVLWDFTPFRGYANGVDQIEVRVMRSAEDQIFRVVLPLGPPNPPEIFGIMIPPQIVALNEPLWFRIIARDLDRNEPGNPLENRSSSFGYFNPNPAPGFATLECLGFEAPMDRGPVDVTNRRVLPLKAQLFHADGAPVIDSDLLSPPALRVLLTPDAPGAVGDVTEFALAVGLGTNDRFVFTDEGKWQFNLAPENYSARGTYTVRIQTGDSAEYIINPGCVASFRID